MTDAARRAPPRIDHIGILVAHLEQAAARLAPLFGEPFAIRELPEVGLRVAELRAANVTIELLQYTATDASSFAKRVMGERLGLNHVSAGVDDLAKALAALQAAGLSPQPGFPRRGAHGTVAFFEPDPVTGLLFEICQPDPDRAGSGPDAQSAIDRDAATQRGPDIR